ncbi:MAG: GTPase HflX [Thermoprotei archaeon]|nr:MAG: GTPase HflX [Thermoprotei archaeon]
MVKTDPHDHTLYKIRLTELAQLAEVAGYKVVDTVIQVRRREHSSYCLGKGKVQEVKELVKKLEIDTVIFYNILKSNQKYNLEKQLNVEVIDRYDLTLEIFDKSASDKISKLQIELARLTKAFPYEKLKAAVKYLVEHPGKKSMGEYAYHSVIKQLRKRIKKVRKELEALIEIHEKRIRERKEKGKPIVCLTGYYGAGKTSIFNALTGLNKPVTGKPFTTLSSKYYLISNHTSELFIIDTIGFALDLDPRLIDSFKLTLNDIKASDIVLLIVDISDPLGLLLLKLKTSLNILKDLGITYDKIILVLNKIDKISEEELKQKLVFLHPYMSIFTYVLVSAKTGRGLDELLAKIENKLSEHKAPTLRQEVGGTTQSSHFASLL